MSVPLYWHRCDNFGDALSPWLAHRICGQKARYVEPGGEEVPFLMTGSIFGWSVREGHVWGTGCAFDHHLDPKKLAPPSDRFKVHATRGNLSKRLVQEAGHQPLAAGDPALFLPRLYTPRPAPKHQAGIVCSWADFKQVKDDYKGIPVLNAMTSDIESFIDVMTSWDIVVSSCLHGLVAAIAYGKPVIWAQFYNKPFGDGFKFRDFFSIFDVEPRAIEFPSPLDFNKLARTYDVPDLSELWDACPLPR